MKGMLDKILQIEKKYNELGVDKPVVFIGIITNSNTAFPLVWQ